MQDKTISLTVENRCDIYQDPYNPKVTHVQTILPFLEAAKLATGNANLRDASDKKPVRKMLETIQKTPRVFHNKNQGITYVCSEVKLDEATHQLTIPLPKNGERFGIVNGGHTLYAIQKSIRDLFEVCKGKKDWVQPYVKLHIIAGEEQDVITHIAEGLNTTTAVKQDTIYEYRNEFEPLKKALKAKGFDTSLIGKEWDIKEITQRMACFFRKWTAEGITPSAMYRQSGKTMEMFVNPKTRPQFEELYDVIADIVTLPEFIQAQFSLGGVLSGMGRRLGRLKVAHLQPKPFTRPGTPWQSEHKLDHAATLPIAAAFRELLVMGENGRMQWSRNPHEFFLKMCEDGKTVAVKLYDALSIRAGRAKSASQLGSDSDYWTSCEKVVLKAKEEK